MTDDWNPPTMTDDEYLEDWDWAKSCTEENPCGTCSLCCEENI